MRGGTSESDGPRVSDDSNTVELLMPVSAGGGSAATHTAVTHGVVTSKVGFNKWLGLVGVVAALVVAWSLVSGSNTSGPADSGSDSTTPAAGDPEPDGLVASELDSGKSLAGGSANASSPGAEGEEDVETPNSVTDDASSSAQEETEERADLVLLTENGQPASTVLDRPIGYAVLVSGSGSKLELVDLEQPRTTAVESVRGEVALTTESHIVVRSGSDLWSLALDDLGAEPVPINAAAGVWAHISAGPLDSQASLLVRGFANDRSTLSRALVDLVTGATLRAHGVDLSFSPLEGGPGDIGNVVGGGVFVETSEGEFQRFSDGWALAASDELVLIRQCSDDLTCSVGWFDRPGGGLLRYGVPKFSDGVWWGSVIDSTSRWLWTTERGSSKLIEIETGRVIELPNVDPWPGPGISGDGRWATFFDHSTGWLHVMDLETEEVFHLEHHFFGSQAALVPIELVEQSFAGAP